MAVQNYAAIRHLSSHLLKWDRSFELIGPGLVIKADWTRKADWAPTPSALGIEWVQGSSQLQFLLLIPAP